MNCFDLIFHIWVFSIPKYLSIYQLSLPIANIEYRISSLYAFSVLSPDLHFIQRQKYSRIFHHFQHVLSPIFYCKISNKFQMGFRAIGVVLVYELSSSNHFLRFITGPVTQDHFYSINASYYKMLWMFVFFCFVLKHGSAAKPCSRWGG